MAARHNIHGLGLLVSLLSIAASFPSGEAISKRATYFITNNPIAESALVAVEVSRETGLLIGSPVVTPTGGMGGEGVFENGLPVEPDSLFTQDTVVSRGNYILAVNAGSHTLSLFYVNEDDPTHPVLLGKPADTLGEWPTCVAYSPELKTACVANAGTVAGVVCFSVSDKGLKLLDKSPRRFISYNQTTPETATTGNSVSDIVFNPSSTALFVTTKGVVSPGYIFVWPVKGGKVSRRPIISTLGPTVPIPFSVTFGKTDSRFCMTDLTFGYVIAKVLKSWKIELVNRVAIPNQSEACWTVYSEQFDSVYVNDANRTNVVVADPFTGDIKSNIPFDESAIGAFDNRVDRTWLYILAHDASIIVIDLLTERQIQRYNLTSVGNRGSWEGLAFFPTP